MNLLDPLFAPRAIAVFGASATPGTLGAAVTASLTCYPGPVLKVNAGRPDPGRGFYPSVADAAEACGSTPDLAIMCVPAAATAVALREAAAAGARAALVCAGGFAGAGSEGTAHRQALTEVVRETGIRVLGPNTSGFLVPHRGLTASFVLEAADIEPGPVAVVAADGGVNHALAFALSEAGVGLRLGVGLGDSLDVTHAEVLTHLAADEGVRAVALHVDTAADGRRLADAVRLLAGRTPVVALVVGRSDAGDLARSRTSALSTSWRVTRAALRQSGAVLVDDERDLVDAVTVLSRVRLPARPRAGVGLVTAQAGPGLLMTDNLRSHQVHVPGLEERTVKELGELLPDRTHQHNPVDTGRSSPALIKVVESVSADPGIDVTAVCGLIEPTVVDLSTALVGARAATPLVAVVNGPAEQFRQIRKELAAAGIPCAASQAAGATMVRAVVEDAAARARVEAADLTPPTLRPLTLAGPADGHTAKRVLTELGIRTPVRRVCADRTAAHRALDEFGGPVVVKVLGPDVLHRSEPGGVQTGIRTRQELEAAVAATPVGTALLVEQMAPAGPDLIVGVRRDLDFGPVVYLGTGGSAAEALGDVSVRLAPLSVNDARTMLDELAALELYLGARGIARADRTRLTQVLLTLSCLAADDSVAECEINPLRVLPDGDVVALDAVLLLCD
ncbi:acetate--CoA ligase family protein [Streptomyces sp. NPDC091217]|uniref:acetate--CoA ligase family protein n=1 Tax=Streptomyces sp. NPDC091217 TaxID=3365975 RepID=UPI00380726B8